MRESPDGIELLIIARDVLRRELLPLLPKDRQVDALMIANAMGIAERQLRAGEAPQRAEQEALSRLLDRQGILADLSRAFAVAIRAGHMDGNAEARRLLWESTLQRVRESAPRALTDRA